MTRTGNTIVAIAVLGIVAGLNAAPPDKSGAELTAVRIAKPIPEENRQWMMFGGNDGTALSILISAPGKHIIGIDHAGSSMSSFVDDKKTNLTSKKDGFGDRPGWMGGFPQMAPDGTACAFDIVSDVRPAAGATKVIFKGAVSLLCGANEKSAEQKGLKLAKDSKLTAGPVPMTVSSVDDQAWGDFKMGFSLAFDQSDAAIKDIVFTDAAGKVIEHGKGGRSSMSLGKMTKYEQTWQLKEKVDTVNVKVIYYDKVEKVAVPINIDTGIGF